MNSECLLKVCVISGTLCGQYKQLLEIVIDTRAFLDSNSKLHLNQMDCHCDEFSAFDGSLTAEYFETHSDGIKHDVNKVRSATDNISSLRESSLPSSRLWLQSKHLDGLETTFIKRIPLTYQQFFSWLERVLLDPVGHGIPSQYVSDVAKIQQAMCNHQL